jgi:dephospho-CoA kinase
VKHFVVGLTGGIGSGKSAAAEYFSVLGVAVIDADAIAHELTRPAGAALPAIAKAFGREALAADGSLDRAAMRRLVFGNPERRGQLEAILHPLIRATSEARCDAAWKAGAAYVMMVVPLLVESGNFQNRFDRIVVIDCPEALQVKRVMARSGLTAAEVKAIMMVQASRQARLNAADDVITNDSDLDALRVQVAALHEKYYVLAEQIRISG